MMQIEASLPIEKFIEDKEGRFSQSDVELIKRVNTFAKKHYSNIEHPIGKPYNEYATEVAKILTDLYADPIIIASALIYPPHHIKFDVLEEIKKEFKNECALIKLVEEVHHLNQYEWNIWPTLEENDTIRDRQEILRKMFLLAIDDTNCEDEKLNLLTATHFQKTEKQAENLIRMLFATTTDIRALLIKLADRLLFMRLLKDVPPLKQDELQYKILAKISITIYASVADRLGMWQLKSDLEDMSFRLLDMYKYKEIASKLAARKQEREEYLTAVVIPTLEKSLKEYEIEAEIHGRAKHIYSIYKKMEAKLLTFNEINDLLGVRIIVKTDDDCYLVQEIIHELWSPDIKAYGGERGRDWIANPKENGYQSLHTTIIFEEYRTVEIQIRTHEMHEKAEFGAAAEHWRYKIDKIYRKGKIPKVTNAKDQIWSQQLTQLRKSLASEHGSSESAQEPLLKNQIFVITPKGHVIDLRTGATPLDFAYRIHTDLGHRYTGAKVDGHIVRLNYQLKNGEIVELITSRARTGPSPEWLAKSKDEEGNSTYVFAQTPNAREKIHRELNKQKPKAQK
jgi:GTP diphosphokinase / guanosine-3',5'-bis(diphosphate) 3'-diphosphatase